jgi:hypothetical protein
MTTTRKGGAMRRPTTALVCFLLIGLLAGPVAAAEKNFGLGVKLGYHNFIRYTPTDDPDGDGVLEDGEIDYAIDSGAFDGFTPELDFEYRFHPYFTLGGAVQWYGANIDVTAAAEEGLVKGEIALSVLALTVTPRLVLPVSIVRLYTGAGLGLYWRIMGSAYTYTDQFGNKTSESYADSQGAIGYHAMLGLEILVRDWVGIVLEDRFAFVHFKGQDPLSDLDDVDAGGNSLFLGARFHF